jgi:hypothetical protein
MSPTNLSRRAILAGAASVPALAGPALALPPALASAPVAVDPIYAAIEAHRTANLEFHDENFVDEDHPQYEKEMQRLSDSADVAAGHLCDVQPMTIAGAIALLNYYAEVTVSHDGEDWPGGLEDKQAEVEKPFGYFFTRNVARALATMAV